MRTNPDKIAAELSELIQTDVFGDILHRAAFSTDSSIYSIVPSCVVAPRNATDISAVVQYARQRNIAIVARGTGTGVAGESLCSGIVLDMNRYMNKIVGTVDGGLTVTCQPGVVLDELNEYLRRFGRKIGPDPSTSNRATVGGCIANNSTGAHSLEYGYMGDYVERIRAVLADGSEVEFSNNINPSVVEDEKLSKIAQRCLTILSGNERVILAALPRTSRNRSGYNIAGIYHNDTIDMARLLAGSEGTLAIFTEITLRTVPLPQATGLLQLEFDSLEKAAQTVPVIVETTASACELMDKSLLDMAREGLPQYRDILPAGAEALLLVEHTGNSVPEVKEKIKRTIEAVGNVAGGRSVVLEPHEQQRLWKCRKDAVPLLDRKKGRKRPVPFIEDVSVGRQHLGEYITALKDIARRHKISISFYGHAGDGELHIRPYLDLSDPDEVRKMQSIAEEVFSLAWSLGGSISGEHADGLVRAAFIKRQYGEPFYNILREIKNIFDPVGLLNPGKIITDEPDVMVKNLRARHKILPERIKTELLFEPGELELELEQCNGCGLCLSKTGGLRMCPVFRALGDELGSSRAKANILRFWATGQMDEAVFESAQFRKLLDLCINCKACSLQCPSGVDISKLIEVARARYAKQKGLRPAEYLLSHNRWLGTLGCIFHPISNLVLNHPLFKWLLEKVAGIDKKRDLPPYASGSFIKAGREFLAKSTPITEPIDKVAYFVDTYANYNDHELGLAVLEVLRHNDIEVALPEQRPAPLPAICYGDIKTARKDLAYIVSIFAPMVQAGYKIICSEPSAALCLQKQLRHFVAGEQARIVSANTYELMSYLLDLFNKGKLKDVEKRISTHFVYHCPCHLLAIGAKGASIELLQKLCGVSIVELESGCCGLAGTFGMQKKNYELSSKIAERLAGTLNESGTKSVLTECSACKMQIEHISNCIVRHPIKIIADCYGV